MFAKTLTLVLALACAPLAMAAKDKKEAIAIEPQQFADTRGDIEDAIRKTDRYSELTLTQREKLQEALDRMEAILAGVESVDALEEAQKTQLFNDQELVNSMLTEAAEDSRLICKREKRVGSHRYTNSCITVAERRRLRDSAIQDARLQRGPRGGSGIGGLSTGDN